MLGSLRHRFVKSRASAWVLVALAVRSLVPDGFMVGAAMGGGPTVIFCHGVGMAMPVPAAGGHHDAVAQHHDHAQHTAQDEAAGRASPGAPSGGGQHHAQQGQCAFAASSVLAPPPYVAPPAQPLAGLVAPIESAAFAPPQERVRRPGARAPPAFS
jgi:hypothetical protein